MSFGKLSEGPESDTFNVSMSDRMSGNAGCVLPHADLRHQILVGWPSRIVE
ncbi:MAG: hypothetical protein QGH14_06275 [Candidatus Bathyarchaeota archaeon]|nr:hypothetical protein [Candidatus Bathyarchaeota archaeon]